MSAWRVNQGTQAIAVSYYDSSGCRHLRRISGFPKIRVTFLGIPMIRTIVYWGLYWGTLILGNCHMAL